MLRGIFLTLASSSFQLVPVPTAAVHRVFRVAWIATGLAFAAADDERIE
jgi:hypothetical protein